MPSRTSLDSRVSRVTSPSTMHVGSVEKPDSKEEECFEDVGLEDEAKPKKKGLLSRFGDFSSDHQTSDSSPKSSQSHLGFRLPGRKRGQSGGGSELGAMKPKIHVGEAEEP
ncbi:hypothetical protein PHISP_03909 [Aspergillus sp. HF37]|nr:hypothetical protein PHISP_03909 [Aspergillus sp. HF37]